MVLLLFVTNTLWIKSIRSLRYLGADLDLKARGGTLSRATRTAKFLGAWLRYVPPSVCTHMTIDKVTRVKSLKQNNMPVFFISSKFICYIFILQVLSKLFLNGQNVSDTVLNVITNHKKMVENFFRGGNAPPPPPRYTTGDIFIIFLLTRPTNGCHITAFLLVILKDVIPDTYHSIHFYLQCTGSL